MVLFDIGGGLLRPRLDVNLVSDIMDSSELGTRYVCAFLVPFQALEYIVAK